MSIYLSESELRNLLASSILEGLFKNTSSSGEGSLVQLDGGDENYSGPLVVNKNGKKYLVNHDIGLSKEGFWSSFRDRLEKHIENEYPQGNIKIETLGVTRDLRSSADTGGNNARVSGSKHGSGLAQDVKIHSNELPSGRYTNFKTDNAILAKNPKLVQAIVNFMKKPEQSSLIWGGTFGGGGSGAGDLPRDRGILEFHHFEIKSNLMPDYFKPYQAELEKIGINYSQLNSISGLSNLYKKLA